MSWRTVEELVEKAKWLVFAVGGTDRSRPLYWRTIALLRSAEMRARRDGRSELPDPLVDLTVDRGFAACDGATLGGTEGVVDEVRRTAAVELAGSLAPQAPEQFGVNLRDLPLSSPLMRFALSEQLVASAAAYLGVVPILAGIQLMRATHLPGAPSGSQLFHCDHDDLHQVKVFVLCSEVADENGPLTVLDAATSRAVKRAVRYRYGGRSLRLTDAQVDQEALPASRTAFVGPPGRVMLVDTSACLHFGARIRDGASDRLMVQFQYLTPAAFELVLQPRRRRIALPGPDSSALERRVLGA